MTTQSATTHELRQRLATEAGCLLLTLDSATRYLPRLGVVFEHPHNVRSAARECWTASAALAAADADAELPFTVDHCIPATLARHREAGDAARVTAWLRRFGGTRIVRDQASAWAAVSFRYTAEYETALQQLGVRAESASVVRTGLANLARWSEAVADFNVELEASVRSDWDVARYDEYQRETPTVAPTDFVPGWLLTEAFLAAVAPIVRELNPQELRVLEEWARAVVAAHTTIAEDAVLLGTVLRVLATHPPLSSSTTPALWAQLDR